MSKPEKIVAGMKFGRWTTIKPNGKRKDGTILWHCRCDCGKEGDVPSTNLRKQISCSCGCYREERRIPRLRQWGHSKKNSEIHKKRWGLSKKELGMVENTNLSYFKNAKVRADNKTGVRGVTFEKGKFVARIRFNGVKKYLGAFKTIEEARKAREKAEEDLIHEIDRLSNIAECLS